MEAFLPLQNTHFSSTSFHTCTIVSHGTTKHKAHKHTHTHNVDTLSFESCCLFLCKNKAQNDQFHAPAHKRNGKRRSQRERQFLRTIFHLRINGQRRSLEVLRFGHLSSGGEAVASFLHSQVTDVPAQMHTHAHTRSPHIKLVSRSVQDTPSEKSGTQHGKELGVLQRIINTFSPSSSPSSSR